MTRFAARFALIPTLALALAGCPSGDKDSSPGMTQQQRDSLIGESMLPGAQGVRGALDAVDAAGARAQQHDTIR